MVWLLAFLEAFPEPDGVLVNTNNTNTNNIMEHPNRVKRDVLVGVTTGLKGFGAIAGGVFRLLERPGGCCRDVSHGYCGDGTVRQTGRCT